MQQHEAYLLMCSKSATASHKKQHHHYELMHVVLQTTGAAFCLYAAAVRTVDAVLPNKSSV